MCIAFVGQKWPVMTSGTRSTLLTELIEEVTLECTVLSMVCQGLSYVK